MTTYLPIYYLAFLSYAREYIRVYLHTHTCMYVHIINGEYDLCRMKVTAAHGIPAGLATWYRIKVSLLDHIGKRR